MNSFVVCSIFILSLCNAFSGDDSAKAFKSNLQDNRIWFPLPEKKKHHESRPSSLGEYARESYDKENFCFGVICDRIVRHAQELSRLKLIRRYVRDTVVTLDRFVTALDAELIAAGEGLQKSFGKSCQLANAILNDVTEEPYEFEGFR